MNLDSFSGDGATTDFTLSINAINENNTQIFIDGVYQQKDGYTVTNTTLSFSAAPPLNSTIEVMTFTQTEVNVPVDNSIEPIHIKAGDFYFDTDTLYIDSVNNRVGVGTSSPTSSLDVTGTVTADGLTVDASSPVIELAADNNNDSRIVFSEAAADICSIEVNGTSGSLQDFTIYHDLTSASTARFQINQNGDISFYEDTGTTAKLFWDASAESLGIGTTSPSRVAEITSATSSESYLRISGNSGNVEDTNFAGIEFYNTDSSGAGPNVAAFIEARAETATGAGAELVFATSLSSDSEGARATERLRIDSTGNVGIGTDSPSSYSSASELVVDTGVGGGITVVSDSTAGGYGALFFADGTTGDEQYRGYVQYNHNNGGSVDELLFGTAGFERMRIDSSGRVGIGVTLFFAGGNGSNLMIGDPASDIGAGLTIGATTTGDIQFGDATTGTGRYAGLLRYQHADDVMAFWTASDEKMRIDSSGRLLINKTSSTGSLSLESQAPSGFSVGSGFYSGVAQSTIEFQDTNTTANYKVRIGSETDDLLMFAGGSERMRIDASGNVGIGTASPVTSLTLGSGTTGVSFKSADASINSGKIAVIKPVEVGSGNGHLVFETYEGGSGGSERMRIDSSGNLLVGKTSADVGATAGIELYAQANKLAVTRASGVTASFNLLTDDGTIVDFKKDGAAVGSIGTSSADLTIGTGDTGLYFWDGDNAVIPWNVSTNSARDNLISLGTASNRFDDAFITNGVTTGSDRNQKQDIEALSDAEQRVAVACKALLRKWRWIDAVEAKGDDARIHFGIIAQDLQAAFEAEGLDAGRYAMFMSNTWTDDDGNEQTRLGVRYSELLAFIIAAI